MILSHIVAMSQNRVIGKNGGLPWNNPEDMKFFREKTKNHIIIMGRKTFESLPKILPNRFHIVVSRSVTKSDHPDVLYVSNLDFAYAEAQKRTEKWGNEVFVIGGGEIYRQSLPQIDRIYLTRIESSYDGDAFYPEINLDDFAMIEKRSSTFEELSTSIPSRVEFSFLTYDRKGL